MDLLYHKLSNKSTTYQTNGVWPHSTQCRDVYVVTTPKTCRELSRRTLSSWWNARSTRTSWISLVSRSASTHEAVHSSFDGVKPKFCRKKIQHRKCSKPQTIVGKAVIHTVRSDADIVSNEFEYVRVDSGGSKKQVLDGVHIGATWRIRLNRPSAMACGVFVKLLWLQVVIDSVF